MTMRSNAKETRQHFEKAGIPYQSKLLAIREHQIHVITSGDSTLPALVFIHGSPGSWDAFKTFMVEKRLLEKYYLVAIDRPGFGYSDFGEAQSLQTQTELLHEAIRKLGLKSVALVGHSMGGPVICDLAGTYPESYKQLYVLAGSVDPAAEKPERWRQVLMVKPVRYLVPQALRTSNDELFWLKADLYDLKPKLKNISGNVRIIHGTKDRLVPYSNVDFLKKALTAAQKVDVVTIENADHFIPWSHYEIVLAALINE